MDFQTALAHHSGSIRQTLQEFLKIRTHKATDIDELLGMSVGVLQDFSLRGGKHIRSFVARTAYELAGGKPHPGLDQALASIELHHQHILILDDIADRDEQRYGGPTVEYAFRGVLKALPNHEHAALSLAMLDGVLLGAYSKDLLLDSGFAADICLSCIRIFNNQMYEDTLAGWEIHAYQCLQPISQTTPERFIKGLELVTARYTFEGPFRIGLALAGNSDTTLEKALVTYATLVGTAFQMRDDELGLFGDTTKTGKPVGNDVREGKKTLLIQEAYTQASLQDRAYLDSVVGKATLTQEEVEKVQKIVQDTGSFEKSRQTSRKYITQGIQALEYLPDSPSKQLLIELAHYVIEREK